LAKLFYQHIVCFFGMPSSIIMDHGSLFTSQYWSSLYFHIKARRKLSTAFHPQTDGQMERQNQTLEYYLHCYINYRQNDWVKWLLQAEFAYNNAMQALTRRSPFYTMYAYNPLFTWDGSIEVPEGRALAAHEQATIIKAIRDKLVQHLR